MIKFVKRNIKYFIILLAFILVPQSLNIQSELNMRVIVTSMAIDYIESEYQVSAQIVQASGIQEGGGAKIDVIDAKGKTVSDATNKLSLLTGKTIGLSHVTSLVLGQSILKEDKVMETLDYFMRENLIPTNAVLLISDKEGKETLEKTKKLQLSSAVGLQKIYLYKQTNASGVMTPLNSFVNDYFKLSKTSIISGIQIEDPQEKEAQQGSAGSGGGSGSSSSSSGGDEKSARIKYDNKLYLFKEGKHICTIEDEDQISGIYLVNQKSIEGAITIENITSKELDDATVSIYVRDKKSRLDVKFEDGKPKCKITITTNRNEVYTVDQKNQTLELFKTDNSLLTDEVISEAEEKLKNNVLKAFNYAKSNGVDIMELGDYLYKKNPKAWRNFLREIGTGDYIKHLDLEVEVTFKRQL